MCERGCGEGGIGCASKGEELIGEIKEGERCIPVDKGERGGREKGICQLIRERKRSIASVLEWFKRKNSNEEE